jgi:hypothetical protein
MTFLSDGPEKFIEHACRLANQADCRNAGPLVPGVTISFSDFIWMMYKFTKREKSNVELEGKIEVVPQHGLHSLVLFGIRDPGVRMKKPARYLPKWQRGQWSCILEDALIYGVSDEEIRQFRHSLNLLPSDGVSDAEFFRRAPNITI